MAVPGHPVQQIGLNPSPSHRPAKINAPIDHKEPTNTWREDRQEWLDQKTVPINILFNRIKGHSTPTYVTYPDVPNTVNSNIPYCNLMRNGPQPNPLNGWTGHNGIFYIPRVATNVDDIGGKIPLVMYTQLQGQQQVQNDVFQFFNLSEMGDIHRDLATIFGTNVHYREDRYVFSPPQQIEPYRQLCNRLLRPKCKYRYMLIASYPILSNPSYECTL